MPPIIVMGFTDSVGTEQTSTSQNLDDDSLFFKVEVEINLKKFIKEVSFGFIQDCSNFQLLSFTILERTEIGLPTFCTFFRDDNGSWLKSTRLELKKAQLPTIINVANLKSMVYSQKLNPASEACSANIKSILKTRNQLDVTELVPLPFFFIEKMAFLGQTSWQAYHSLLCSHGKLLLNYYDIFDTKHYHNLLYANEYKNIENSKTLRYERQLIHPSSVFYNKLLLGITMLPKPIAEALLENDPVKLEIFKIIKNILSPLKCTGCLNFYGEVRRIRVVERYLFLRYQTYSKGSRYRD